MRVGKIHVLFPVIRLDGVSPRPYVITDRAHCGFVDGRRFIYREPFEPHHFVNRVGVSGRKEFSDGFASTVLHRAGDLYRTRRHQSDQHVLVNRHLVFTVVGAEKGVKREYVDKSVRDQVQLYYAAELGLGQCEPGNITIEDINVPGFDEIKANWV